MRDGFVEHSYEVLFAPDADFQRAVQSE